MTARQLYDAGYTDLVSVVPPDAPLSPKSNLKDEARGKVPGVKRGDGLWSGYNWLHERIPPEKMEEWGANVGLLAANYPGLDIDCDEPQLARFVEQESRRLLGPAPTRTSREPRRLLVFRTDEPFGRVAARIRYKDRLHTVEVLGAGRQYLILGAHPSGTDYGWEGKPLHEWAPDDLTTLDAEQALDFLAHLQRRLAGRAEVEIVGTGKSAAEDAPPQETLEAPSLDALRDIVERIPNRYPDRESYIQMGCAVKAAGGDPAYTIFADWAARWEGGTNEPETVEADWGRMHPPFRVGWPWLREQAEQEGYVSAVDEFDVVEGAEPEEPVGISGVIALSDTWVVERLVRLLGDKVRFVPETGQFHIWE